MFFSHSHIRTVHPDIIKVYYS